MAQENNSSAARMHHELSVEHPDPLVRSLHIMIRACVRVLAVLMAIVIVLGVGDVGYVMVQRLLNPPIGLLNVAEIFQIFGAFMVVLIAIEIFINIRLYLGTNILPIKLVIGTALMAIARKVIVLDISTVSAMDVLGIAAVTLALGIAYWLVATTGKVIDVPRGSGDGVETPPDRY